MSEAWKEFDGVRRYIQKKVRMFAKRTISIGELNGKIAEYMRDFAENDEPIFLTKNGRVIGVIVSPKDDTNLSILAESVENMLIAEEIKERARDGR